ncbi:MAG: nucleotidyltransferase family protein [Patescibacteria group bacterium]|nr:nucleotidyltransferase family protein [Patescibacteria group bacterium]
MPESTAPALQRSSTPALHQAVIMAAGLGTRLRPHTLETPKPLLAVAGRPILEWNIDALPKEIEEIILVVGYLQEKIREHFGAEWGSRRVRYIEQAELKGTGHALFACQNQLHDRFLVLNGDDLYGVDDLAELARHDLAILAKETNKSCRYGAFHTDEQGRLLAIIEGGETQPGALVNAGAYVLDRDIFDCPLVPIRDGKEFGLPQTVVLLAQKRPVDIVRANFWVPIGFPDDLEIATAALQERL